MQLTSITILSRFGAMFLIKLFRLELAEQLPYALKRIELQNHLVSKQTFANDEALANYLLEIIEG